MPHIKILNQYEIKAFDFPPEFNGDKRKQFFNLPKWVTQIIEDFGTPVNKIGFVLQLGYFRATHKFFTSKKFYKNDIEFVAKKLNLSLEDIDFSDYKERSRLRHREIILDNLGFQKFEEQSKLIVIEESFSLALKQVKPRFMFWSLVDLISQKKIEVPSYYLLSEIITNALKKFEEILLNSIRKHITIKEKHLLDQLLETCEMQIPLSDMHQEESQILKSKQYKLTLLKKSSQSLKPSKIKENIDDLKCLKNLYEEIEPVIKHLSLTPEIIKYYASIVIKSQVFQISRREDNKYLLLIAFVIHQYYSLNDTLIETLLQSVQSSINSSIREHKENLYEDRKSKYQAINDLFKTFKVQLTTLQEIQNIVNSQVLSNEEKIKTVKYLTSEEEYPLSLKIQSLELESKKIIKNSDYYDILEANSLKLQNRASLCIKYLVFDNLNSNNNLIKAINYYKIKDGSLDFSAPIDFMNNDEQDFLFDDRGKIRVSLYKVILFQKIASAIKSGALNLYNSYKYKSFESYLIQKNEWGKNKEELLKRTDLTKLEDFQKLESILQHNLKSQYSITNNNIDSEENKYAKITPQGTLKVLTPKLEKELLDIELDLFPKNSFISVFEVLYTINKVSNFLDCFEHWQIKYNQDKPDVKTFFAGIICYGCNLGVRKIAKTSRNINQNQLENVINWYFSVDNLNEANNKILELTEELQLPIIYRKEKDKFHTSSDGQKFNIAVDSLNASYSYKYFGKGKGVTVNTFIDESHRLTYSDVISSSEREAAYVIDGLMHNDVIKSDIHSTDTHGYSEIIFGVTYLLGISFAPRIKNFKDQQLYSFEEISNLKAAGYKILPAKKINSKIIMENWDTILNFVATIKSNTTTASQLFRRLSSYSHQHPLYKALKEFGKIIKTLFLLQYIDDLTLRQAIEKQLNKLESSNKFAKAVFYGNNQEFQQSTKDEQLIAEGSKRLIENAIICWNYLYLSQLVLEAKNEIYKHNLLQTIKNSSVITWQHINLQGEFDFSDETLQNSFKFRLPEIFDLKV